MPSLVGSEMCIRDSSYTDISNSACAACVCIHVGRLRARLQFCQGFLDIDGRWNNGFFCRHQSTKASSSGRHARLHYTQTQTQTQSGCCGNETYRFCCHVTPSLPRHVASSSTSATTSVDENVPAVSGHQLVRSSNYSKICWLIIVEMLVVPAQT